MWHCSGESTRLVKLLESSVRSTFGFPVKVILREANNLQALVTALPDAWVNGPHAKCDVMFLGEEVDTPEILDQLTIKSDIDDVRYVTGAVLWYVDRPNATKSGMMKLVGTELYANMTIRNCSTVRKLEERMR